MKKPSTTKPVTPVTPAKSPAPATSKAAAPAPAPIKKPAAPVATKPAPTPVPAPVKKVAAPAPAPAAPAKAAAPAPTPAPAPKAAAPVVKAAPVPVDPVNPPVSAAPAAAFTVLSAKIDVGFGNTLYIRGEGPGLSWTKGLALKNAGADEWTISLPRAARPITFKFLLNDSEDAWCLGDDYSADPGTLGVFRPEFSQG